VTVRTGWAVALAVLVAAWVLVGVASASGPDPHDFRKTAAKSARGALSAVRTARLSGQADLDGRVTDQFLDPVLENALEAVATAQQRLAEEPPPGPPEAGTRDELADLLGQAQRATTDLAAAVDDDDRPGVRAAVDALGPIGDGLDDFIQNHPS
jgi:hypothetical protein